MSTGPKAVEDMLGIVSGEGVRTVVSVLTTGVVVLKLSLVDGVSPTLDEGVSSNFEAFGRIEVLRSESTVG